MKKIFLIYLMDSLQLVLSTITIIISLHCGLENSIMKLVLREINWNNGKPHGFLLKDEDVGTWIRFLIETPDDEIQEIINTYEAMRTKYEILVKALERVGIDYKKLRYTK